MPIGEKDDVSSLSFEESSDEFSEKSPDDVGKSDEPLSSLEFSEELFEGADGTTALEWGGKTEEFELSGFFDAFDELLFKEGEEDEGLFAQEVTAMIKINAKISAKIFFIPSSPF